MIVVAVIAYATIAENPPVPDDMPVIPHIDKLIHAIMFGGLAGAVMFDIRRSGKVLAEGTVVAVCLGCAVAGAGIPDRPSRRRCLGLGRRLRGNCRGGIHGTIGNRGSPRPVSAQTVICIGLFPLYRGQNGGEFLFGRCQPLAALLE